MQEHFTTETSGPEFRPLSSQLQNYTITTWAVSGADPALRITGNVSAKSGHEEIRCDHKNATETSRTGHEQKPSSLLPEGRQQPKEEASAPHVGAQGSWAAAGAVMLSGLDLPPGGSRRSSPPASEQPVQGRTESNCSRRARITLLRTGGGERGLF